MCLRRPDSQLTAAVIHKHASSSPWDHTSRKEGEMAINTRIDGQKSIKHTSKLRHTLVSSTCEANAPQGARRAYPSASLRTPHTPASYPLISINSTPAKRNSNRQFSPKHPSPPLHSPHPAILSSPQPITPLTSPPSHQKVPHTDPTQPQANSPPPSNLYQNVSTPGVRHRRARNS